YSDCWVEDSRLVVLNARDAQARGAEIMVRTKVLSAAREDGCWTIETQDTETGETRSHKARMLVNAGGPWVGDIIQTKVRINSSEGVRLVRGSHIVVNKVYDHDKCYFFQGTDGRIIFAIPYEGDYTLIGTTDADHADPSIRPECTDQERDYLLDFANQYFNRTLTRQDIVWTYSGVRPLYDDGATSATAATRDYTLKVDKTDGAPVLNVFGGKITTYRRLAESALEKIEAHFQGLDGPWTADAPLPGGDFPVDGFARLIGDLQKAYPFLDAKWAKRLIRAYGTEAADWLGDAQTANDLGRDFGATLTEREVRWMMDREFARSAEDVVWRRTKLGLRLDADQIKALDSWMATARQG
ncbi:MAG: glycerol-3-phosphate dehydrogenase, partial [Pseudomonadota bacterium]